MSDCEFCGESNQLVECPGCGGDLVCLDCWRHFNCCDEGRVWPYTEAKAHIETRRWPGRTVDE